MHQEIVSNVSTLGAYIRRARKKNQQSMQLVTEHAGTARRFLSDLEHGKKTVEMGKVLAVLDSMGLELVVQPKAEAPQVGYAFEGVSFRLVDQEPINEDF